MSYYVRLLTAAEKAVPFSVLEKQCNSLKLVSGSGTLWDKIEIYQPADNLISVLERLPLSAGGPSETAMAQLKSVVASSYPVNAREWLRKCPQSKPYTLSTFWLRISPEMAGRSWAGSRISLKIP
jgi:hypothetical protein